MAIVNPAAYDRAVKRNIINNARNTFFATFPRGEEVEVFLNQFKNVDDYNRVSYKEGFMGSMAQALNDFGKLSQKQYDVVVRIMDEQQAKREAYKAAIEAQKAQSQHLGVEKLENVRVTVDKVLIVDAAQFSYYDSSWQYVYLMRDDAGNRIVYKTKTGLSFKFKQSKNDAWQMDSIEALQGCVLWINAGIKAHTEYKGEKQTIITRAKVLGMEYDPNNLKDPVDVREK